MSPKQWKKTSNILTPIIVIYIIGILLFSQNMLYVIFGALLLVAEMVGDYFFEKCPRCKRSLSGKKVSKLTTCPFCGEPIR